MFANQIYFSKLNNQLLKHSTFQSSRFQKRKKNLFIMIIIMFAAAAAIFISEIKTEKIMSSNVKNNSSCVIDKYCLWIFFRLLNKNHQKS